MTALDDSAYTRLAGSGAGLELMASVVSSASRAGNDLADALSANAYEGGPVAGYPADDAASRTARHAAAVPRMAGLLGDAAHRLDLSATGCRYLAHGIAEDLSSVPDRTAASAEQRSVPALTLTQYDALKSLADGGRLYESATRGMGVTRVATDNGTRISIATYRALNNRGLVTADNSTSLYHGQKITVTEQGRRALDGPRPRAPLAAAAATAATTTAAQGVRR
ncbi:hypothetical protein [Streptomyces sp. SID13726]|uniref:hypothetical protein n=1 Tax=Streptomyces sp. SID13726 TaxID=2706058 RepID=UPI001EF3B286|nr:hypothetical protein [Streptomyces sp. SID13726]